MDGLLQVLMISSVGQSGHELVEGTVMHHTSTGTLQLSPTGALMDPDYLRHALRPSPAGRDLGEVISWAALIGCAFAIVGIAVGVLARVG